MDWLIIPIAVIASLMIGIILYRMDKNKKKSENENTERERSDG